MPTYLFSCPMCGRREVIKPMGEASRPEQCPDCLAPMRRIFTPPLRTIVRPSGYRLAPDDPGFSDFRREMELGQIHDDATPVTLTPSELARWDDPPVTIAPDPERDHQLSQLLKQHWTNDLSPGIAYNRELAAKRAREEQGTP